MRHQRGYIFETHGAFHLRYYVTADGVRKQKSTRLCAKDRATGCGSTSAKAVRELAEDFLRTLDDAPTPDAVTIAAFWEGTYLPFITENLKPSTVHGYRQVWSQHLQPHFAQLRFDEYKTPNMTRFLTGLCHTQRPRTLANIKNIASAIFAHAVANGTTETNPIRDAMVLGKTLQNSETKAYTLHEAEQVINALVDHVECQLIMAIAFFVGLRKGEIQGLKWEDFDGGMLHVQRAFGRGVLGTPKSRKSVRRVPVIKPVRLLLECWKQQGTGTGWVFPSQIQTAVSLDRLAVQVIRPALKRAGVPWKGFHACRRGLGTELRALTGNSNAGQNVLGHSTPQVTQQHYEHAMPEEALRGMRLLEEKVRV